MQKIVIDEKFLEAWGRFYNEMLHGKEREEFLRILRTNPRDSQRRIVGHIQGWHLLMFEPLRGRAKVRIPRVKGANLILPHFRKVFSEELNHPSPCHHALES